MFFHVCMYPFFCFQASSLTTPVLAHQQPGKRPLLFISLPIICFCFLSFHGMEITAKGQSHSFEGKWEMGNRVQGSLKGPHYCKFHCDVHHCFFLLFRPCLFVFAFYSTSPPTNQPTPSFTLALASGREHELDELEEFAKERTKKKRKKRGSREEEEQAKSKRKTSLRTWLIAFVLFQHWIFTFTMSFYMRVSCQSPSFFGDGYFSIMQQAIIILIQQLVQNSMDQILFLILTVDPALHCFVCMYLPLMHVPCSTTGGHMSR